METVGSSGFAFVLNIGSVEPEAPIEIIPNYSFARATPEQISLIKPALERFSNVRNIPSPYEFEKITEGNHSHFESFEPDKLKYYVINFAGTGEHIEVLELMVHPASPWVAI